MTDAPGSTQTDIPEKAGADSRTPAERAVAKQLGEESTPPVEARRGPGRPPGSTTKKTTSKRRGGGSSSRRFASPPPAPAEPAALPPAPPEPTEDEIQGVALALAVVWELLCVPMNRRTITEPEALRLAKVTLPVIRKYGGGSMAKYAEEISLGMTLVGLWYGTRVAELKPNPDSVTVDAGERAAA